MTEVFLAREALGDGLPRHDLRRWYRPIFRGVYIPKGAIPNLADRTLGAWLASGRTGIVSGAAAAALHGADWVDDDEPIEILAQTRRRQPGLIVRADAIADDEITEVNGTLVTTPVRTAFDLGRYQKRYRAIGRLDALMRVEPFAAGEVMALVRRYGPVRGVRQLRELLPLVDPGAASPAESKWRLLLVDNGFPMPATQVPIVDDDGEVFALVDMGWRDIQLAVEYDGDQHRTNRVQYVKDRQRIPRIERRGWGVNRIIAEDHERDALRWIYEMWLQRGGAEIDKMAWATRTFPPVRTFGQIGDAA